MAFTSRAQQLTAHPIYVNMSMIKAVAEITTCVMSALTTRGRAPCLLWSSYIVSI